MDKYRNYYGYDYNYTQNILDYFYLDIRSLNNESINAERIYKIQKKASGLIDYFNNQKEYGVNKYIDVMKRINKSKLSLDIRNTTEKFLLFIFVVDPNYELFIEYGVANKSDEIKKFMLNKYRFYDPKLIIIEKFFVKYFLSQDKKEQLNEEIEKRIYG